MSTGKCYIPGASIAEPVTEEQRGLPAGSREGGEQGWIEWYWNLYRNYDDLFRGVISGLVFGAPIVRNEEVVGYTPSILPKDIDSASTRFVNCQKALFYQPKPLIFYTAVWRGLKESITDVAVLLKDLFWDLNIYSMIRDGLNAIAASPEYAYALGQLAGGGMVASFFGKMDGTFEEAMDAMGEFIGSILLDIILAFLTGGVATLVKGGARVVGKGIVAFGRVAKESFETAAELTSRGVGRLKAMPQEIFDTIISLGEPSLAAAGMRLPQPMPGRQGIFFSEMDDTARALGDAARNGTGGPPGAPSSPTSGKDKPIRPRATERRPSNETELVSTTAEGEVMPAPKGTPRRGYESGLPKLEGYQDAHLWGRELGFELPDGIMKVPKLINGIHSRIANRLKTLRSRLDYRVFLKVTGEPHPESSIPAELRGYVFASHYEYDIWVISSSGESHWIRFSYSIDKPEVGRIPKWYGFELDPGSSKHLVDEIFAVRPSSKKYD